MGMRPSARFGFVATPRPPVRPLFEGFVRGSHKIPGAQAPFSDRPAKGGSAG
jgi:hypothetical protein